MAKSVFSVNPLQHWVNTSMGVYEGYPLYGEIFEELLGQNIANLEFFLDTIVDKIEKDLGSEIARLIDRIEIVEANEIDEKLIVIILKNEQIGAIAEL